ncbi:replicative DNA helicase [Candidatus Velamenicoccus archaeovorus]|uniref:Replicative DNA helicase n=1 Tax=Velamenicoccus archaeovorus TaxID=1930593 RepID=A0A410P2K3_VELA1|nr:replicative DNA helicase [Candidatus Velamenicoccus archaeovorus]QAT16350.1 replicative DNA helicase [Candidatus Velamenicoccus archaeovorus]
MKKSPKRHDKEGVAGALAPIEKLPPQNIEAEMAVLGCMLIEEDAIGLAVENLSAEDFYKDAHKKIFSSIVQLYDQRKAVDLITLIERLRNEGVLEEVGGASYLTALTNTVPTAANVSHYSRIVKEKNVLRLLIHHATQIVTEAYDTEDAVGDVLDRAEKMIFEIADRRVGQAGFILIKEIIKDSIETIDRLYQNKAHVTGVATGYTDFDIKTAGLQPSDLIIVAGRPSMGKSAFVINILEHASIIEKIPTAFFSLEMSKEQLVQRLLCSHARVDAHKVRTGYLSASDWPSLTTAAGKLSEAPIFIDDTPGISVLELRAKARRLKAHHNIGLIALDYLQLMRGTAGVESRQQEISEISRSLKALARELNVPVIAISQLSRAVESRTDHRPQLSDLRESGAIEQDADVVVLLIREEYYNPSEQNRGIAEAIIAKQRNGPVGTVKLAFIKEYTRFENLTGAEAQNG